MTDPCYKTVDDVELGSFIVEREPDSIGVYSRDKHTCEIYERTKDSGFEVYRYRITKGKINLYEVSDINLEDLLKMYSKTSKPLPDIFSQYMVYRERDCYSDVAYPGRVIQRFNDEMVSYLESSTEKAIYLSAMLSIRPETIFEGPITTKKVNLLLGEVTEMIHTYLHNDIDYRET